MFRTLGDAFSGRTQPRSTARDRGRFYRRDSRRPGPADFRKIDRNDRFRIKIAARIYDRQTHKPRQHGGELGLVGLAVLDALLFVFLNMQTGRCDPSFETIAAAAGCCPRAAKDAMDRLEAAGFIVRQRRIIVTRHAKQWPSGKVFFVDRAQQITNAYRLNFPFRFRPALGDLEPGSLFYGRGDSRAACECMNCTETNPVFLKNLFGKGWPVDNPRQGGQDREPFGPVSMIYS